MARNDGRIEPGQKLAGAISARAWNRAQDAADRVFGVGAGFGAGASQDSAAPYTWVYAKNGTGSTVNRWGVMAITGVEITPTSDASAAATKQFEQMPVLTLGTSGDQYCIAIEPIENNKIGRVAVAGVSQCKAVDASKVSGSVLWKNNDWALVRFGGGSVKLGWINATWNKGATATVTELNGDGTAISGNPTIQAINHLARVTILGGTKRVVCAQAGNFWILIASEC